MVVRDGELDRLLAAVQRVPAAGLVAVVVSGEAGIGKSHLIAAAADRLAALGWPVLRLRADRLERQVPYAALATALHALTGDNSFTEGVRRDALAALDPPAAAVDSPGAAFGRACATVARLLTALTATGRLAVVVDDLHELDDDSLALLTVVQQRLASAPVALVFALRSHLAEPNAAAEALIDRLADRADLVTIRLGTLAASDIGTVIGPVFDAQLQAPPDERLVQLVHRRCDGNPYFAVEIAHSLLAAGLVAVDAGRARLAVEPRTVALSRRTAVLRRVLPLTPEARAVARTLAVFRKVSLDRVGLVAHIAELAEPGVLTEQTGATAFDDLIRAHVVVRDAAGMYRFSHDIVADALYDDIGPAQTRRMHAVIADRLRAERRDGETVDLLELAWHVSASASPGDAQAVTILAEAARRALSSGPEAAAGLCAKALDLLARDDPQRAPLLALQCRALARASRPAAAVLPGRAALAAPLSDEDRLRTTTAVLSSLFALGRFDEALDVADRQRASGPLPPALRAQRAVLLAFAGRTSQAEAEAAKALAAEAEASPAEAVVLFGQLGIVTSMLFRHDETVAYGDRALASARDSTTLRLQALAVAALTEALAGLVPEAAQRLRRAAQFAPESGLFDHELSVAHVVVDWLGGRWDGALERIRPLAAELDVRQQATLAAALTAVELEIRTWRGELVLAAPLADRPAPTARNMASLYAWARAGFLAARGDADAARDVLVAGAEEPIVPTYAGLLLSRLAELDLEQGRTGDAAKAVALLAELTGTDTSPWAVSTLHRCIGLVHGDADALALAVRAAEDGGLVFERARALLASGGADPIVEAYRTFARLGAHGLRRQAGRRLQELGAKVPRVRSRAAGLLTESEEKVARLVQQGMRNREIAAALHYTPRSVEVYLSRIFTKLRVSSRLELARALDAMDAHP